MREIVISLYKKYHFVRKNLWNLKKFLQDFKTAHDGRDLEYFLNQPLEHFPSYLIFVLELLKNTPMNHQDFANLEHAFSDLKTLNDSVEKK